MFVVIIITVQRYLRGDEGFSKHTESQPNAYKDFPKDDPKLTIEVFSKLFLIVEHYSASSTYYAGDDALSILTPAYLRSS